VPKKELAKRRAADARRKQMEEAGLVQGAGDEEPVKNAAEKSDRKKNKNKNKTEEVQE